MPFEIGLRNFWSPSILQRDTATGSATPAGPGGFDAIAFTAPSALATMLQNILVAMVEPETCQP